jgi:hypothetical protein
MTWRSLAVLALVVVAGGLAACGGGSGTKPKKPAAPGEAVQPPGVYTYATTGADRVKAIVTGRHDYPPQTPITVIREGCGVTERWDPLPERWSESSFCLMGKRWRLSSIVDYHSFFGESLRQRYDCRGRFVPRPALIRAGFTWVDRCTGPGATATLRGEALGPRRLEVEGKPVETVLVRLRAELSGRVRGVNVSNSWLRRTDGLLVRREVTSDTDVDSSVGKVKGIERYSLRLRSLEPSFAP